MDGAVLTTWVSPFTSLPRALPALRAGRARQRLATLGAFALLPTVLFWVWYGVSVVDQLPASLPTLRFAIPVAALWITLGPPLMQQGEFHLEHLLDEFSRHGAAAGWDLAAIQRRLDSVDRAFYPTVITAGLTAPLALALSFQPLGEVLPVAHPLDRVAGLVVIGAVGICSTSGLWGAAKVMLLVHIATRSARLRWRPFHSERAWGIRQLYSFAWSEGTIFSLGGLFVPAMLAIQPQLSPASAAIVWVFVVLLLTGGLALFSIPVILLHQLAQRHKDAVLDAMSPVLDRAVSQIAQVDRLSPAAAEQIRSSVDAALRLRAAIALADPAPFSFGYLARASTTLILPVLLTVLQIIGSG